MEKVAMEALTRETVRELVNMILDWRPLGAEAAEEGDEHADE